MLRINPSSQHEPVCWVDAKKLHDGREAFIIRESGGVIAEVRRQSWLRLFTRALFGVFRLSPDNALVTILS